MAKRKAGHFHQNNFLQQIPLFFIYILYHGNYDFRIGILIHRYLHTYVFMVIFFIKANVNLADKICEQLYFIRNSCQQKIDVDFMSMIIRITGCSIGDLLEYVPPEE